MNVLFLTLGKVNSIHEPGIYNDLLCEFAENGHKVYIVSPVEKRENKKTELCVEDGVTILHQEIDNIQKVNNIIKKGIATVTVGSKFKSGIKKYFSNVKFDLVLYATPPITFLGVVRYLKKRNNAFCYLMLKDIFPQNSVDLGMMSKSGVGGQIYNYFRRKEIKLYEISDEIGCMSPKNVEYVLNHNKIDSKKVELSPNSIRPKDLSIDENMRLKMRQKYGIPTDKTVFVYGGNLGKPQGVDFIIDCLKKQYSDEVFFFIVGNGTEYNKLNEFFKKQSPKNAMLMEKLPREEYDSLVSACDVGLIFLDKRFTIPNYPSRLLAYLQAKLPVLACTDVNSDIGQTITENGFGWWCESKNADDFVKTVATATKTDLKQYGKIGYDYLVDNFNTAKQYETIMSAVGGK